MEIHAREEWKTLEETEVFAARPWVTVTRQKVRTGAGLIIDDFYRVDLAPFVVCVPELSPGEFLTLWSYKHGPRRWGMSFPAGLRDEAEEPEHAMRRELLEETGYAAGALTHLGEFLDNGNQGGCLGNYYLARACVPRAAPSSGDLEHIEVRTMSAKAIDEAILNGEVPIIHHVAAWSLARLHLARSPR